MGSGNGNHSWIKLLLMRLELFQQVEDVVSDVGRFWAQLEKCQFLERIEEVVEEVNQTAGRDILHLDYFLPPQSSFLKITFSRSRVEHVMKIVLWSTGPALIFYSHNESSADYDRRTANPAIEFVQYIQPEEVTEDDIQRWFSYLLSGFKRKFRPVSPNRSNRLVTLG